MADPIGVLLMAYGTPAGPDDVERYYTHVRRGRPPTAELLADLRRRYDAIGGVSPLLEITRAQAAGIQAVLDRRQPGHFRVVLGMKHAPPFVEDAVAELRGANAKRAVGLVLAPQYSSASVGEYAARAEAALADDDRLRVTFVKQWHLARGYLDVVARAVGDALDSLPPEVLDRTEVVFTAHSLPERVLASGDPYAKQVAQTASAVAERVAVERWRVAWQSAGRTEDPWIGPDVRDVLASLPGEGVSGVVVCPVGFVSDHLEVLYDVDVECRRVADAAGLAFARSALPNADPTFLATLADVVLAHLAATPG